MDDADEKVILPKDLVNKIRTRVKGTEFASVSDYVIYVLRNILANIETPEAEVFDAKDEAVVKERLKKLGYLD